MSFVAGCVCTYEEFNYSDRSSTVQQNDSDDRTQMIQIIIYKIDNVQNSTNTVYDNLVCTGSLF